jgi:hypothetical protein
MTSWVDISLAGLDQGELIKLLHCLTTVTENGWSRLLGHSIRTLVSPVPGCSLWTGSGFEVAGLIGMLRGRDREIPLILQE